MAKTQPTSRKQQQAVVTPREVAAYLELKEQLAEMNRRAEKFKARLNDMLDSKAGSHDIGSSVNIGPYIVEVVPHARTVAWKEIVVDRLGQEAADSALESSPFSSRLQITKV